MENREIEEQLRKKLVCNMRDLEKYWLGLTPKELIELSGEIEATRIAFDALSCDHFPTEFISYLLRYQHPLEVVRDKWLEENNVSRNEEMKHVLWSIVDAKGMERFYVLDEDCASPDMDMEVTMC